MSSLVESTYHSRFQDARNKLAVILGDLAKIAKEHPDMTVSGEETTSSGGSDQLPSKRLLAEVLQKRAELVAAKTPFRVAVVGEFSRGKSTLINALLGREVLV